MAARIPTKQITSWSFSRYITYRQCPLKAKLKFIDKIPEPGSPAMDRGNAIHKMAECYTNGSLTRFPKELDNFKELFKELRAKFKKKALAMVVEDTWAFTKNWDRTVWNDWANCWLRIKLDNAVFEDDETLLVNDWKTGKFRETDIEDYLEQLELYATGAFLIFPHVEVVKPRLVYLDLGTVYPDDYTDEPLEFHRKDLKKLVKTWEKRVDPMLRDKKFAPRPNDKCKWCHYRAANKAAGGGQCKF